jgi:hypothetical protein
MGRKSLREESLMAEVINMSWRTIKDVLKSDTVDPIRKQEISLEIVKKSCPKELSLDVGETILRVVIERDTGNSNSSASEPG